MKIWTTDELVKAYIDTIQSPPNAWGQHVHPLLGRSEFIMLKLWSLIGEDATILLIQKKLISNAVEQANAQFRHQM
jgi:hypothetical protein